MKSLILLVTFIFAEQVVGGEFYNINGTNYWISHPLKGNYHQAYRNCAINGMYLVSIHTQQNHNAVAEAIATWNSSYPADVHFWTSGTSLGHPDKEFYWAQTGYPITFSNWITGSPSVPARKCLLLHGGTLHQFRWWDQSCDAAHHFICEDKINLPKIGGTSCQFNIV